MMNMVQIEGFLGKDPVVRATQTGRIVATFSVAANRNYTNAQGEQQELTDWVSVKVWGHLAEAVGNTLKKGTLVYVTGRYTTSSYDGKDGVRKYRTEVTANMVALPLRVRSSTSMNRQPLGNNFDGFSGSRANSNQGNHRGGYGVGFPAGNSNGGGVPVDPVAGPVSRNGQASGSFNRFGPSVEDEDIPFGE